MEALAYVQQRLVGWAAYKENGRVENIAVTLKGCALTLTQRRTDARGVAHLLERDYPLSSLRDPEWYTGAFPSPASVSLIADNGGAVIRYRWDNDPVGTYLQADFLSDLPAEFGERIASAFLRLKQTCVPASEHDPFAH